MSRATAALFLLLLGAPALAASPECEAAAATTPFPDRATIEAWSRVMARFGPRPTASEAHRRFINWLRRRLREVPGVDVRLDRFSIRRQKERSALLTLHDGGARRSVATAGPIPYSRLTGRDGVSAPLVYLPPSQAIADVDVRGQIVLRDHVATGFPYAAIRLVADYLHDPAMTLPRNALYERDYLGYQSIVTDLRDAGAGGAAGLIIVHEFARDQVRGHYEPYEGVFWNLPALYLGVDEGEAVKALLARGAVSATITLSGGLRNAKTHNVLATLPGPGRERVVIASHTDGINAVWDNGPIAMLALAHHLARLPVACRSRTIQFGFSTAHLYLSQHGAARFADQLKAECDTVALAVALEHLGAREHVAVARDGAPGRTLVTSGFPEFLGLFVTPTPALIAAGIGAVTDHDLQRTGVLRFSPDVVSGEGGTYHGRGIPTVALIAGPWSLYNPAFGLEAVDLDLFRRQTIAVRDLLLDLDELPRDVIAGGAPCTPELPR
jgi:hypothetical protein